MEINTHKDLHIRPVKPDDLQALKTIVDANELFPSDMLDEMISEYFGNENSNECWFTYDDGKPLAIAYCAPEKMTKGTWNLHLIAVHPDYQRTGYGSLLLHHIEQKLAEAGERILLAETSGLEIFEGTQEFYRKCGYQKEAQIREFYQAGEDKVVFRKSLADIDREYPALVPA